MVVRRTRRKRRARVGEQMSFRLVGRGGPGRKQGRKKRSRGVSHARRAFIDRRHPVHVSTRVLPGLPSLRGRVLWETVRRALALCCKRPGFRIVHFSVQGQHIHLICEADDRKALSRGVQAFKTSVARRLNGKCGRRGVVFGDRYHERIIHGPTDCRYTVAYVLNNQRHHAYEEYASYPAGTIDPYSSGRWFDGWTIRRPPAWGEPVDYGREPLVAAPESWLLAKGWMLRGGGRISPDHIPALPRNAPPLPVW